MLLSVQNREAIGSINHVTTVHKVLGYRSTGIFVNKDETSREMICLLCEFKFSRQSINWKVSFIECLNDLLNIGCKRSTNQRASRCCGELHIESMGLIGTPTLCVLGEPYNSGN